MPQRTQNKGAYTFLQGVSTQGRGPPSLSCRRTFLKSTHPAEQGTFSKRRETALVPGRLVWGTLDAAALTATSLEDFMHI